MVRSSSSSMYGISRSSKLLFKVFRGILVGEGLSSQGRKHMDWVAWGFCPGVNSWCLSSVWAIWLLTLCARSGGLGGQLGFDRMVTFPGNRNTGLLKIFATTSYSAEGKRLKAEGKYGGLTASVPHIDSCHLLYCDHFQKAPSCFKYRSC